MINGFTFNNHHSSEFNILLESYIVNTPSKKKISVEVPYRHGTYDFSTVNTGGENTFSDRTIEIKINVVEKKKSNLQVKYNKILQWLIDTEGRSDLIFDDTKGYKFFAEVVDSVSYEEFFTAGSFKITFIASPFRIGTSPEGSKKEFNTFNFEEDILQNTMYAINGNTNISIINTGKTVTPSFIITGNLTIQQGAYISQALTSGTYTDYNIRLKNGINNLVINGNGTIEILFNKEAF